MTIPEMPDEQRPTNETTADLALRLLYDEQVRLRAELDQLRQQSNKKDEKPGGEDGKEGGGEKAESDDQKQGEAKDGDKDEKKDGDKEKKGGDKDEQGKDDGKDDEKKPSFKERMRLLREKVRDWIRKHPVATILIVIGVILLVIGGLLLWRYLESYENTDDAFVDGHTDPISPRVSGIVVAVYVENTYRVKKGQLLAQLDERDNQVAKEQATANYTQAQAAVRAQAPNVPITTTDQTTQLVNSELNVLSASANVAATEGRYRSAIADLQQAEANRGNAAREEERYRLLVGKEEVTREQYDQRATEERAQAAVVASRREAATAAAKAVTQAESQLGMTQQQAKQIRQDTPRQIAMQREMLVQRKASEQAAKAQADQSELNFEYTRIFAPEDGIIGDKQVQVGTQVAPGQELFALTQTNDIWVTANFKETQIKKMRPGQSVTILVDALGMNFEGYIEALPGASGAVYSLLPPENATGNYVKVVQRLPVRIRFKRGQPGADRLAPGMSVEPKVWVN